MTHPCNECDFIATSARQLSRHKAVTHVENPLKCVLCPFVTAYQTNLLRHRREVHGILGSKGHKSCKFCSFQADDNDKLILHQQQAHQDILKSARERFAREKKSARGACNNSDHSSDELDDQYNSTSKMEQNNLFDFANLFNKTNLMQPSFLNQPDLDNNSNVSLNQQDEDDDDRDFWKEGFIDNPASLINFNQFNLTTQPNFTNDFLANFQKQFQNFTKTNNQFDLNGLNNFNNDLNALNCFSASLNNNNNKNNKNLTYQDSSDSDPECSNTNLSRPLSRDSNIEQQDDSNNDQPDKQIATVSANQDLAPTKIRRQYICQDCDFRTVNPREFLYHRRDVHNQKVKIVECPYCVYACQYFQKLQRHMLLVHKLKTSITPPTDNSTTPIIKPLSKESTNNQSQNSNKKDNFADKKSTNKDDQDEQLEDYSSELAEDNFESLQPPIQQQIYQKSKSSSPAVRRKESTPSNQSTKNSNSTRKSTSADDKQLASTSGTQNTNGRQPGQIKCKYCQFLTDSFSKLEKHENTFHLEKRFRCPFCEIKFENLVWLQRHLVHMHNNNEKAKVILDVIESIMPRRKRVKANQNNNSASTSNDVQGTVKFDEHGNPIIEKDSTKCPICSYETKWFSELQKHIRVHTNEKPYSCQLCSFRTKWKGDLNRHINKYHAKAVSELKDQDKTLNNVNSAGVNQRSKRKLANISTNLKEEEDEEEDEEQQLNNDDYMEDEDEDESNTNDNLSSFANNETELNDFNLMNNGNQIKNSGSNLSSNQNQQAQQSNSFKVSSSSVTLRNLNSDVKVKVYKCSYCDFICNTASRFHVHYVQHLNTKPFMCSACECRSNYEWDIVKHIKMKVQKGEDGDVHVGAKAILVHPSGNRDYKKYDKYLTMINKNDIDGNGTNQQDTRGLIDHSLNVFNNSSNNLLNNLNGFGNLNNLSNLINSLNSNNQTINQDDDLDNKSNMGEEMEFDLSNGDNPLVEEEDDEYFNSEEVVIEPDINFSIGNELDLSTNQQPLLNSASAINSLASSLNQLNNLNTNLLNNSTCSTTSSNNTNSTNKPSKLFYCAYCDYTHRDSKSLVSHLSKHAGKKPFKCRICNLASNWREVLNRHVSSRHSGTSADIEQLFKYTVSKYICRIIDEKGQLNLGPEITTQEKVRQSNLQLNNALEQSSSSNFTNSNIKNNNPLLNNLQDYNQQQNSLMMLNSILAQQLSNCDNLKRLNNSASSLLPNQSSSNLFYNLSNLSGLNNLTNNSNKSTSNKSKNTNSNIEKPKPKVVETPEVLAAHGITGRVSGFKGEYKCDKCPFRAEKAFHMDFHNKRHVQAPGAEHKCPHCDFWVHAKKSLVKHIYLHKYDNN